MEQLATALDHYTEAIERDLGTDVREMPGSGASGGLGTGLHALPGATLHPRYDIVMQYLQPDHLLQDVDLVFTAERSIDFQAPRGKIPVEVARRAKQHGLPVIAIAGAIGQDARINLEHGIEAYATILKAPCTLSEAIADASNLVTDAAEQIMRLIVVGQQLKS